MKVLLYIRHLSWIAVICSLIGSCLMFVIGATKTYHAFNAFIYNNVKNDLLSHLSESDIATTYLIKSLDAFLIALVLFIFAYGVYSLFIHTNHEQDVLTWIDIPNISHLKNVLAEVIIVIIFVKFLEVALMNLNNLNWNILTLPMSIVLLALGLKLLNLRH